MWGLLAQVAGTAFNMYQTKKADEERKAETMRAYRVTKTLAAESLAITYNSILSKSVEFTQQARRREFEIVAKERQAAGGLAVQAAAAGVEGKRAELAREQATASPTGRALAANTADLKNEQDALMQRADMEAAAMVSRLIQNSPDMPGSTVDILGGVNDILGAYGDYQTKQKSINKAITGSETIVKPTAGVQLGLQTNVLDGVTGMSR